MSLKLPTDTKIKINHNDYGVSVVDENDNEILRIDSKGKITSNSDTFVIVQNRTIVNANDPGEQGETCGDADYLYRCVATDTWIRFAKAAWES